MFIITFSGIKQLNKLWKKAILKCSATVMLRGTPCSIRYKESDISKNALHS